MIKNFVVESYAPKVDKAYAHLLPTVCLAEHVTFDLEGVNSAISNALRCVILSELPVKGLTADISDIHTNCPEIIHEMISKRVSLIPIKQSVALGAKFDLDVENALVDAPVRSLVGVTREVLTGDFHGGQKYFNQNIALCDLQPGTKITIHAQVRESVGYIDAGCIVASGCVSKPIDNLGNVSVSSTKVSTWQISFTTNGTEDPKSIVRRAIDTIIQRVEAVKESLGQIKSSGNQTQLTIVGESDTVGNLIVHTANIMYPELGMCSYVYRDDPRAITIHITTSEDIQELYRSVIAKITTSFRSMKV